MDGLISRQMAIEACEHTFVNNVFVADAVYNQGVENCLKRIKELPSAQTEIVRCKDCKYYTSVTAQCEIRGKGLYLIRGLDDFCSKAERRTDETD